MTLIRIVMVWVLAWVVAVVAAAGLGSIVQTQVNMGFLAGLGAPVGLGERMGATWHDLVHFTPLYAAVTALAFIIAIPVGGLIVRAFPPLRSALYILAGAAAILAVIGIMNNSFPMTVIAATRVTSGVLGLALAGAVGGWLFAVLSRPSPG